MLCGGLRASGLIELFRQIACWRRESSDRLQIGIAAGVVAAAVAEFRRTQSRKIIGAAGIIFVTGITPQRRRAARMRMPNAAVPKRL